MEKEQYLPARVTVSDDKMLAIITIGQATYKVDAKVLSEFLAGLMVACASILPPVSTETLDIAGGRCAQTTEASRQTSTRAT